MDFVPVGFVSLPDLILETVKRLYGSVSIAPIEIWEVGTRDDSTFVFVQNGRVIDETKHAKMCEDGRNRVLGSLQKGEITATSETNGQRYRVPMTCRQLEKSELSLWSGGIIESIDFPEHGGSKIFVDETNAKGWLSAIPV